MMMTKGFLLTILRIKMLRLLLKIKFRPLLVLILMLKKENLTLPDSYAGHADCAGQQKQRESLINNNLVHSFTFQRLTQGPDRTR